MGLPIPPCWFTSGNIVTNGTGRPVPYKLFLSFAAQAVLLLKPKFTPVGRDAHIPPQRLDGKPPYNKLIGTYIKTTFSRSSKKTPSFGGDS